MTTLLLYWFLMCEGEKGAEIYICANSRAQASLIWEVLEFQRTSNKELTARTDIKKGTKRLLYPRKNPHSYIQVLSAEGRTAHGGSPLLTVFDELSWSKKNDLHTAMTTGSGARLQPLFVTISTVSHIPDNAFAETLEHAKKVRDKVEKNPRLLPVVMQIPNMTKDAEGNEVETNIHDRSLWHISNPNLNIGLPNDLETCYRKALAQPSYMNEFKMTRLNMICPSSTQWLDLETWDKGQTHTEPSNLDEIPCAMGIDLSSNDDVTATLASWFIDDVLYLKPTFFIPKANIWERIRRHKIPWDKWSENPENNIHLTEAFDGKSVDYKMVVEKTLEFCESHNVETIYYDRYKWSSVIADLMRQGIDCVAHGQGFESLTSPCQEFERLVAIGKVSCRNPVFRWMLGNTSVENGKGGLIKIVKPKNHDHRKIDAVVCGVMTINHHTAIRQKVIDFQV